MFAVICTMLFSVIIDPLTTFPWLYAFLRPPLEARKKLGPLGNNSLE